MNIRHKALILVADGQRYLIYRNEGRFHSPELRLESAREEPRIARTAEQGADEPGTAFSSAGPMRSSMGQTDFHQQDKDRLAAQAAESLRQRALAGDFEELIVVAPPRTLAELRRNYDRSVMERLVAEIDKDLTKHTAPQIIEILTQ